MKIAFFIENFNPARGGAEQYVADLSQLVCQHGHQIHIFTLSSNFQGRENLHLHLVRAPGHPRFLRTLFFAYRCRREVAAGKFDIAHSFGRSWGADVFQPLWGAQMASLAGNIRSISSLAGKIFKVLSYIFSLRRLAYFFVENIEIKQARAVIAISPMVKEDLIRFNHLQSEKVKIVRNGVDLQKFHPRNRSDWRERIRGELDLEKRDILILFVAHNFRLKGLRPLILTLAELGCRWPAVSFKIAVLGEGRRRRYTDLARQMGVDDRVIFLGGRENTHHYYAAADMCVHPSFYDPSALVVLEAMASGLPVITTTFCGTSEIIGEGEEGYVVDDPSNIGELADTIFKLADPDLRQKLGKRARQVAERFPYFRNMQEILEIYDECLNSGSSAESSQLPVSRPPVR